MQMIKMELTKAEEQLMKVLWKLERAIIRNVVDEYDDPKPAYTTVATIMKILENKGFVDKTPIGNTYEYFPLISKKEYTKGFINRFVGKYFSNSYKSMISSLTENENLSAKEMEEIIEIFQGQLKAKKE
jgi:BlaI family penicillinase repressor